jgi:hypothetical protein
VWRSTLGQLGAGLAADGDNNGQIDAADYDVWRTNFGKPAVSSSSANYLAPWELPAANYAVPEPRSAVLWLLVLTIVRTGRTHWAYNRVFATAES